MSAINNELVGQMRLVLASANADANAIAVSFMVVSGRMGYCF